MRLHFYLQIEDNSCKKCGNIIIEHIIFGKEGVNMNFYVFTGILLTITAIFYITFYFKFLKGYRDLEILFSINKLYDIIFLGITLLKEYNHQLGILLVIINFLSIAIVTIKVIIRREPKIKILLAMLSHSEWLFIL